MKTKFEPSDIIDKETISDLSPCGLDFVNSLVKNANAKLEEIKAAWMAELEASGEYFAWKQTKDNLMPIYFRSKERIKPGPEYTHEALLINIKPIEPECAHKIVRNVDTCKYACTKCSKQLRVIWQVIDE